MFKNISFAVEVRSGNAIIMSKMMPLCVYEQ